MWQIGVFLFSLLVSTLLPCYGFFTNPSTSIEKTNFSGRDVSNVALDTTDIIEKACRDAADRLMRINVPVSQEVSSSGEVGISYVHWPAQEVDGTSTASGKRLPLFLVHGFDSSCLEYRRLGPKIAAQGIDTYAVDILGWGFTQLDGVKDFSATNKVEALNNFISNVLGPEQPYCICGASLGGAAAIELASMSDNCEGLVLIDAQGFVDGVGPMASLPGPMAWLGVQVLKSVPLRSSANQMSYYNKETFATDDALNIGRLHCQRDGWSDAMISFMRSGGFTPSSKVPTIDAPALIVWGRNDGILDGNEFANKFLDTLPNAQLHWVEECGHVPHLEKPDETAKVIADFLTSFSKRKESEIPAFASALESLFKM